MSILNPPKPFLQTNAWQHGQNNSLRYNTSQAGSVLPLLYGTTRQQVNLIDFGDYRGPQGKKGKSGPLPVQGQSQGKGGGGKGKKNADFSVDVDFALCQGPVTIGDENLVWSSAGIAFFQSVGLNLYTGTYPQADDPVFDTLGHVVGYSGTCHVTGTPMDLGHSPAIPNISFEVTGLQAGTGGSGYAKDANPANIINDFLTDPFHGAGWPAENLDPNLMTNYGAYCQAAQLVMSPVLQVQTEAAAWLNELVKLTNTALVWSGSILRFIPYGDLPLSSNGATWDPNIAAEYLVTDDDFLPWSPHLTSVDPTIGEDDPVIITRMDPIDAVNWVSIEYLDRTNSYNKNVIQQFDQGLIDLHGLKTGSSIQGTCFCDVVPAGLSARLLLQRSLYARNIFKFQLGWRYMLLEPMDIIFLYDPGCGLLVHPVRITKIEENANGDFAIEAEDIALGAPPPITHGTINLLDVSYIESVGAVDGIADSHAVTFSVWINPLSVSDPMGPNRGLIRTIPGIAGVSAHAHLMITTSASGSILVMVAGADWDTQHWVGYTNAGVINPDGAWHNIHVTISTSGSTSVSIRYDGISVTATTVDSVGSGYAIAFSLDSGMRVLTDGYPFGILDTFKGGVEDVYLNIGTIVSDNSKFRTGAGKAVFLGTNGQNPTGTSPTIYLHWDYTSELDLLFHVAENTGTGGSFLGAADPPFLTTTLPY